MNLSLSKLLCASILVNFFFASEGSAAHYVYDWETRSLTLDGTPSDALDLSKNGSSLFTISFSGGWLSSDNYFELNAITRDDSRIRFSYLPSLNVGEGLPISTSSLDFTRPIVCANEYVVRENSFDALMPYNNRRCNGAESYNNRGGYFVRGYGYDDAASTYRIDVSAVPLPAGSALLLSAISLLGLTRLRRRKIG
ncbi:MAG: hypothetical protein K9G71_18530 [Rhodobacteraceae bacterium]|nr:hypothetical protein [Paracoccaceae bacterium]MCF8516309.1 hypothetical protein [Paracoccaceae bacterium]MCF8520659.1 hypothetical protein [Paracoccaceae bacterium]